MYMKVSDGLKQTQNRCPVITQLAETSWKCSLFKFSEICDFLKMFLSESQIVVF